MEIQKMSVRSEARQMLKRQINIFRWFALVLGLGYLVVFYKFVQAYKGSINNNRFEYNKPFVFDTQTGATYIFGDNASEPKNSVMYSYPVDIQLPNRPIGKDPLGREDGKDLKINEEKLKALFDAGSSAYEKDLKINQEKLKVLYDAGSGSYDLGTYDEFAVKMQSADKRKTLYDALSTKYNLGTYEEYEEKLKVK